MLDEQIIRLPVETLRRAKSSRGGHVVGGLYMEALMVESDDGISLSDFVTFVRVCIPRWYLFSKAFSSVVEAKSLLGLLKSSGGTKTAHPPIFTCDWSDAVMPLT